MTRRLISALSAMVLIGTGFVASTTSTVADAAPAIVPLADQSSGDLYIDESFQTDEWESHWLAIGRTLNEKPKVVEPDESQFEDGKKPGSSSWMQLTTDDTHSGNGESGFILNNTQFSSLKGVVIEYDQRIYRMNNGMIDGDEAWADNRGAGDGLSVFLVDANIAQSDTDNGSGVGTDIDTSTNEAGGFGAGLGYSSVAGPNENWCGANQQQGVAGGWFGLGFDVFGNYANSDWDDRGHFGEGRTRPHKVSGGLAKDNTEMDDFLPRESTRQMIGLRGSGVRHEGTPGRCINFGNNPDLKYWYGMNRSGGGDGPITHGGYQWLGGSQAAGALDNGKGDASTYRKVRIILTPGVGKSVKLEVEMTDHISVSDDVFFNGGWGSDPETPPNFKPVFTSEIGAAELQADLPETFKIGFAASTGYAVNHHQIRNLKVAAPVDLGLEKTVSNDRPSVGEEITYTLVVTNHGPTPLDSNFPATITDGLAGLPLTNVTWEAEGRDGAEVRTPAASSWAETVSGERPIEDGVPGDLVWLWHGPVDSTVTVEITGTVTTPDAWNTELPNTATELPNTAVTNTSLDGGPQDQKPSNNRDTAKIWIPAQPHLTITKDDGVEKVTVGQTTTYELDVKNTGPAEARNAVVTDTLPEGLEYVRSTPADATAVPNDDGTTTVTFPEVASIAAGGSLSDYSVTAKVVAGADSPLTNTVRINASNDCISAPTLAVRCEDEDTNILAIWSIVKASDKDGEVSVGDTITYSVTATNEGPGSVVGAVLTDDLSDVLNFATFVPGSVKVNGVLVSDAAPDADKKLISAPLDLASGQEATLTYQVTVNTNAPGQTLRNVVVGGSDTTPPSNCADPATAGEDPRCWTEHPVTGQYYLNKVYGDSQPLNGATFQVLADINGVPGAPIDNVITVGDDITAGSAVLTGLKTGTYWLKETKAPSGYELLAQPVRFTVITGGDPALVIDADGDPVIDGAVTVLEDGLTIQVKDVASLILPDAGGSGTAVYTVIGVGILLSAAFILAHRARRPRPTVPAGNGGAVTR